MKANDLGLAPANAADEQVDDQNDEGGNADDQEGEGSADEQTNADGSPDGSGQTDGGEGDSEGDGTGNDPVPAKRFNDVMSLFNKTQAAQERLIKAMGVETYEDALIKAAQLGSGVGAQQTPPAADKADEEMPDFMKPGWEPQTVEDVQKAIIGAAQYGAKQALKEIDGREQTKSEVSKQVDTIVEGFKRSDPEFDDEDFYEFATEHKFPLNTPKDLVAVNSAYKALRDARKSGEQSARKNIVNRQQKPVNKPGGGAPEVTGTDYNEIRKAPSILDAAMNRFRKSK